MYEQPVPNELAKDIDRTIEVYSSKMDLSTDADQTIGLDPEVAISMFRPMAVRKSTQDPEGTLRVLAIVHLETGAILDKHHDGDPEDLV